MMLIVTDVDSESIALRQKYYHCPYFRILVIGRANAGKTTIIEKVCGVAQGTEPIIFDEEGHQLREKPKFKLLESIKQVFNRKSSHLASPVPSLTCLTPSMEVSYTYGFPLIGKHSILEGHTQY